MKVGDLTDLVMVVNESASVIVAQPTRWEDGSPIVITYNWHDCSSTFCTKVKGIKKLHYLHFSSPGFIFIMEKAGSPEDLTRIQKVLDSNPGLVLRFFVFFTSQSPVSTIVIYL